jgi:hypothetical protein
MNEELSSRLRRQEFQRMMAQKSGLVDNTINPYKNQFVDPRIRMRDEKGTDTNQQNQKESPDR